MNYDSLRKDKMMALKTKDSLKNKVLTNVLSELMYQSKALGRDLDENEVIGIFKKLVKQGEETLALSKDRADKVAEIESELELLRSYLPKMLSKEALQDKIVQLAKENEIEASMKNKGKLMPLAIQAFSAVAEGKTINEAVDDFLKA